jgi:hypothetical protein
MAASEATIAYLTTLEVRDGPQTTDAYVDLGEVTGLTPPSDVIDEIEVTHMTSPGRRKEFIPGLSDPGSMSVTVNLIPGSDEDEFILEWKASGEIRDTRITYPNGRTQTISTFVREYVPNELTVNAAMTATLTLRCTGDSVFA